MTYQADWLDRGSLLTVCFLGSLALAGTAQADWPQFRGPGGQGHAEGSLPLKWGESEEAIEWKTQMTGQGWSSPVIQEDRLYLTAAVPLDESEQPSYSLQIQSFDVASGRQLAKRELFQQDGAKAPRIHRKNSHASPTPILSGDRIYVHFGHQGTACVTTDLDLVWSRQIEYPPVHGNGGSPVLVDGLLVFSCDGARDPFVIALDAATGKTRWKSSRQSTAKKKFSFSTPLVISVAGQKLLVSPGSDAVRAYEPATGKEVWHFQYDGYSVIPRPVYNGGLLYILTGYDSPSLLAMRPQGRGDITESNLAWRFPRGAAHTPSLILQGDRLYMVSDRGIAYNLNAKTGEVIWKERLGGNFSASPIYSKGRVYFLSEDGTTYVVAADDKYQLLAENALGERTLASMAVSHNRLFIRGDQHLYCIRPQ